MMTSFRVTGAVERLSWNDDGGEGRRDELWRHGCFEAFIALADGPYIELNLAPRARWAAYRFDSYRTGMREGDAVLHRQDWLVRNLSLPRLEMHARWQLPQDFIDQNWHLALSAVIEETDGTKSYWALAHPPGAPDFHHPACFAAALPAPARA